MKKKLAVLFILFAAVLTAGSVSEDLVKKQNKINEKQRKIDEKKKLNQIKYKDNKGKLAAKECRAWIWPERSGLWQGKIKVHEG